MNKAYKGSSKELKINPIFIVIIKTVVKILTDYQNRKIYGHTQKSIQRKMLYKKDMIITLKKQNKTPKILRELKHLFSCYVTPETVLN